MNKFLTVLLGFINVIPVILADERGETQDEGNAGGKGGGDNDGATGNTGDEDKGKLGNENADSQDGKKDGDNGNSGNQGAVEEWAGYASKDDLIKAHESMKGQTGATEKNLRTLRQALKKHGIAFDPESGELAIIPGVGDTKPKRQSKFTDEVRNKFNPFFAIEGADEKTITTQRDEFLNNLAIMVQDKIDEFFESYQDTASKKLREHREWSEQYDAAVKEMFTSYPALVEGSEGFNEKFYNAVIEYLDANPNLRKQPDGELIAADRIARKMQISPLAIGAARKEGFQKGVGSKKIVGNAGKGGTGNAAGAFKRLSKDEYLALSDEERDTYNKKLLDIT
jgi:hypothetical protein